MNNIGIIITIGVIVLMIFAVVMILRFLKK